MCLKVRIVRKPFNRRLYSIIVKNVYNYIRSITTALLNSKETSTNSIAIKIISYVMGNYTYFTTVSVNPVTSLKSASFEIP